MEVHNLQRLQKKNIIKHSSNELNHVSLRRIKVSYNVYLKQMLDHSPVALANRIMKVPKLEGGGGRL